MHNIQSNIGYKCYKISTMKIRAYLVFNFVVHCALAKITFENTNGDQFTSNDYTLKYPGATYPFDGSISGDVVFANSLGINAEADCVSANCKLDTCVGVSTAGNLTGNIVLFTADNCDLTDVLEEIYNAGALAAVQLFGVFRVQEPYDAPVRFNSNPSSIISNPERQFFPVNRVHGQEPARLLADIFLCESEPNSETDVTIENVGVYPENPGNCIVNDNVFVNATISFSQDRWEKMYYGAPWIIYTTCSYLIFIWIIWHSVTALVSLRRQSKGTRIQTGSAMSLQTTTLISLLLVGVIRILEVLTSTFRNYANLHVSEVFGQMVYIYGYLFGIITLMILILYWAEVLRNESKRLINISTKTQRYVLIFSIGLFLFCTICTLLYSLRFTKQYFLFLTLNSLVLGIISFSESVGMIVYGFGIIRKLNQANTLRAGAEQKNLKPFTRLVIGCASSLMLGTLFLWGAGTQPILRSTDTYLLVFFPSLILESISYVLILFTVSPLLKGHKENRMKRKETLTQNHGKISAFKFEGTKTQMPHVKEPGSSSHGSTQATTSQLQRKPNYVKEISFGSVLRRKGIPSL